MGTNYCKGAAISAHLKLSARLRNQIEPTDTTELAGLKELYWAVVNGLGALLVPADLDSC